MAEIKKQMVACPKCGRQVEVGVWDSIDIPYDKGQKEKVLKNIFFRVNCHPCKISFPIAYKCQYNDMEQKYLIWIAPKLDEKEKEEIEEYNKRLKTDNALKLAQRDYIYRIVRNDNELREKVVIFDEGLDDRYIETMKLVYVPVLKKEIAGESKILGLYFDKKKDGGYRWVIILDDKAEAVVVDINMEIYEDMKVKLKDVVEEKTPEGLVQIYALWARDVMEAQVAAAASSKE